MRKGFTLLELLVVVAIMGILGVAAAASYNQVIRGMTERGAVAAVTGVLRAAKERAHVDRQPTAVYCYNRLLTEPSEHGEDNGKAAGVVIAVRRVGRLSRVSGEFLYDEFADLDSVYTVVTDKNELKKGGGFRLYRFAEERPPFAYSIVSDRVYGDKDSEWMTFFSGGQTNYYSVAYFEKQSSDFPASWRNGDGYGVQFMELQLPAGYVFEQQIPSSAKAISQPKVYYFSPDGTANETVDIYSTKPDVSGYPKIFKRAGTATADADKEV